MDIIIHDHISMHNNTCPCSSIEKLKLKDEPVPACLLPPSDDLETHEVPVGESVEADIEKEEADEGKEEAEEEKEVTEQVEKSNEVGEVCRTVCVCPDVQLDEKVEFISTVAPSSATIELSTEVRDKLDNIVSYTKDLLGIHTLEVIKHNVSGIVDEVSAKRSSRVQVPNASEVRAFLAEMQAPSDEENIEKPDEHAVSRAACTFKDSVSVINSSSSKLTPHDSTHKAQFEELRGRKITPYPEHFHSSDNDSTTDDITPTILEARTLSADFGRKSIEKLQVKSKRYSLKSTGMAVSEVITDNNLTEETRSKSREESTGKASKQLRAAIMRRTLMRTSEGEQRIPVRSYSDHAVIPQTQLQPEILENTVKFSITSKQDEDNCDMTCCMRSETTFTELTGYVVGEEREERVEEGEQKEKPTTPYELARELLEEILEIEVFCGRKSASKIEVPQYVKETMNCVGRYCCGRDLYTEEYIWIFYILVQLSEKGVIAKDLIENGEIVPESTTAEIIIEVVDQVISHSDFLHWDHTVAEEMAQKIMWQILGNRAQKKLISGLVSVASINISGNYSDISLAISDFRFQFPLDRDERKSSLKSPEEVEAQICKEFAGVVAIAEDVVDRVLQKSAKMTEGMDSVMELNLEDIQEKVEKTRVRPSIGSRVEFPKIKDFTITAGAHAIVAYLVSFEYKEDWKRVIQFSMAQSDECSDYYFYEAIFSLPTPLYPVAQASVSVFFRIEVSRVIPEICRVDVTYQLESRSLVHRLYQYPLSENSLLEIIRSKLLLYRQLRF